MRQVFSSQRLENVEGVAHLLEAAGIEIKISDGRTYKGASRRGFSYNEKAKGAAPTPAVWVLKPDDFKRARELLHEGGLLKDGLADDADAPGYLPESVTFRERKTVALSPSMRLKLILLGLIGAGGSLIVFKVLLH